MTTRAVTTKLHSIFLNDHPLCALEPAQAPRSAEPPQNGLNDVNLTLKSQLKVHLFAFFFFEFPTTSDNLHQCSGMLRISHFVQTFSDSIERDLYKCIIWTLVSMNT